MGNVVSLILFFVAGELLIHFIFFVVSKFIGKSNKDKISRTTILKGILERTFIVVSLYLGLTSSLTLLGALKIATRIKETEDRITNDFFLIGNLISVLFGILYYLMVKDLVGTS